MSRLRFLLTAASLLTAADAVALAPCPDAGGPRTAVLGYLRAMHEHRFEDAFDHVTATMTDGRSRAEWATLQRGLYLPGAVEIYGVDVRTVWARPDDPQCAARATVANVLSSRDRLNAAGNVEFEIYHVLRDGTRWRVDAQQTLFEESDIHTYFPAAGEYATGGAP